MRRRQDHLHTSPNTNSELNESSDQPGATIRYVPHTAYRRRLFQDEEDSEDELTIYSAKRHRQQQNKQQQEYRDVQKQLDQRRSQSFETTQLTTSPPSYKQDARAQNDLYPNIPTAPNNTLPATLQIERPKSHRPETQENSWQIIRVDTTGAMLTRQKSTPQLYFHARTNKVYTLEGTEIRIERPPRNLIIEYQEILQILPQISLQQIRLIQSNNAIEYDRNLHTYYTPVLNSDKKFYHFAFKCEPQ
jgi:hypothetical protein